MSEQIFEKKKLDKINSPESLDDYIRVSNPGVWVFLAFIILLLVGACIWGFLGRIDSTVQTTIQVENGSATLYVSENDISSIKVGQTVKFEGIETTISSIGEKTELGYLCLLSAVDGINDGYYDGKIVIESHKPLSFILN